jgi:hypothetical protein
MMLGGLPIHPPFSLLLVSCFSRRDYACNKFTKPVFNSGYPTTPEELLQFQGGDFYTPEKNLVQRPTAQELNQFRQGDFYESTNSN